jgi:hypothetical protein
MLRKFLLAISLVPILCVAGTARAALNGGPFDGKWGVSLSCPQAPDGAPPFTVQFMGDIKHSVLHATHGTKGEAGWLSLSGRIRWNGDATFDAHGVTGDAHGVTGESNKRGVPYQHRVTGHFEAKHGTARWVATPACEFTFDRP